jgi:hypothetical protein
MAGATHVEQRRRQARQVLSFCPPDLSPLRRPPVQIAPMACHS